MYLFPLIRDLYYVEVVQKVSPDVKDLQLDSETYLTLEDVPDLDEHAEVGVEDPDAVGKDVLLVEVGDLAVVLLLDHLEAATDRGQPAADQGEHLALHQGGLGREEQSKIHDNQISNLLICQQ